MKTREVIERLHEAASFGEDGIMSSRKIDVDRSLLRIAALYLLACKYACIYAAVGAFGLGMAFTSLLLSWLGACR